MRAIIIIVLLIAPLLINHGSGFNQKQSCGWDTFSSIKDERRPDGTLAGRWNFLPYGVDESGLMMGCWVPENIIDAAVNGEYKNELPIMYPHILKISWPETSPKIMINAEWRPGIFRNRVPWEKHETARSSGVPHSAAQRSPVWFRILMCSVPNYVASYEQLNAKRGRVADIADFEMKIEASPWSVFCGWQDIDHQIAWSRLDFDPRTFLIFHALQLPLHYIKLTPKNTSSNDPDGHKGSSKNPDPPSSSRRYQIAIGFFFLTATVAAVFVALKSAEYADEYWPTFWWLPLLVGIVLAYWLVGHALNFLAG